MASLTGSGLQIQSSIPSYTSSTSNISLNYFQVCSLRGGYIDGEGYEQYGGPQVYHLSGMNLFIIPERFYISYPEASTTGAATVFGSSIRVSASGSSVPVVVGALRIY